MDNVIRMRRVAELRRHPENPRDVVDETTIGWLADSIREAGILQPLLITPDGLILAGQRRHAAARLVGLTMVPTMILATSPEKAFEAMCLENLQREDLTPLQEARAYQKLLDAGNSKADLVRRLGLSRNRIDARMQLLELDADLAAKVDRGELPVTAAKTLSKLEAGPRRQLAEDLAARRVTAASVQPRPGKTPSAPVAAVLAPSAPLAVNPAVHAAPLCPRCAEERRVRTAALDALKRAETVIREKLGARYVPDRPPSVWSDQERRFADVRR